MAPSAVWMSGSATFTIVMSSSSMNVPRQTATSVHHFGSAPVRCPAEVVGSWGTVPVLVMRNKVRRHVYGRTLRS